MVAVPLDIINNHSSLSYKSWTISSYPLNLLNYFNSSPHDSLDLISHTDVATTNMGDTYPTSPDIRGDGAVECSSLLRKECVTRPYQAYCITEASSRPPSPDALIPRPLRIRASSDQVRNAESQKIPETPIISPSLTMTEMESNLAISPRRDMESNVQQESSIQRLWSRNTVLEDQYHITQAVTPRESQPLTVNQTTMYDRTLSQLRMQQTTPTYVATSPAYRRKPPPQHANNVGMDPRPLPPLPVDPTAALIFDDVPSEDALSPSEEAKQPLQQPQPSLQANHDNQNRGSPPIIIYSRKVLHTLPKAPRDSEVFTEDYARPSRPRVSFQDVPPSPPPHAPRKHVLPKEPDATPAQSHSITSPTQLPSSNSLYTPRGLFPAIEEDTRAHRRTRPKDAKFKYQFGHRPSLQLTIPASKPHHKLLSKNTPPHSNHQLLSPNPNHNPQLIPSPYTDGPRPPPWISYDTLETKRQSRSDARERLDARRYRMHVDSRSVGFKDSSSSESLRGEEMRREVEEYKMQVLKVYPEMVFDGSAGRGGREGCCSCIVM
jgi:hypothetical protein